MRKIRIESEKESLILEALARYKYLTISQLVKLGLSGQGNHKNYLNTLLMKMRRGRNALVGYIPFSGVYKFQNREYVYYLTSKGVEALILHHKYDDDHIKRPIGTSSMYDRDYLHRKSFIDIQISLYQFADKNRYSIPLFDTYFDYTGSSRKRNLRAKTSILIDPKTGKRVIPDGLFFLEKEGVRSLYALELHMGNDTGRAMEQIRNHKRALDIGSASEHYGFTKGNRILYVFQNPSIMSATIVSFKRSSFITEVYYPYFLFCSYQQCVSHFNCFSDIRGNSIKL